MGLGLGFGFGFGLGFGFGFGLGLALTLKAGMASVGVLMPPTSSSSSEVRPCRGAASHAKPAARMRASSCSGVVLKTWLG